MSTVRTYQLSAHQRLRFKVHTLEGDYCKRVCICLGGVITGDHLSCKEKQILRGVQNIVFFFMNKEIVTDFEAVKFKGTTYLNNHILS